VRMISKQRVAVDINKIPAKKRTLDCSIKGILADILPKKNPLPKL